MGRLDGSKARIAMASRTGSKRQAALAKFLDRFPGARFAPGNHLKRSDQMGRDKNDRLTTMSVTSFEVHRVDGDWKAITGRWHEVSRQCQGVANLFWQAWTAWHYTHDSYSQMTAWLNKREEKGVKLAGKCPVDTMPKELARSIYHDATARYPNLSANLVSLVIQRVQKTMTARKAVKGSLPGAVAILLHQEAHPAYTKPFPILFDRANTLTEFEPPEERGGNWHLRMRFWRQQVDGKSQRVEDRLELWCKGKKVQSQLRILERIGSGEYSFKGSQLIYSKSKRKWFAKICYEMPALERARTDPSKVAVLSAEENHPFLLRLPDGSTRRPGGDGCYVAPVRNKLLRQRWDRQANYRWASSSSKGHGRERATRGQPELSQRWNDFTKSTNRLVANHVVGWCIEHGVGTLVYEQPADDFAATRFLTNAGKVEVFNRRTGEMEVRSDSTGWDWYGLKSELERACKSRRENGNVFNPGIALDARKRSECEGSSDADNTGTARSIASGATSESCSNGRAKPACQNGRNNKADSNRSKRRTQQDCG